MKKLNMERAIERYNDIMEYICCEHCQIGTSFSESTENWNLRDMVAEADYWLGCYYEGGHARCDMKYDDYSLWVSEKGKLERFIKAYEPFIDNMICTCGHCSKYDN